MAILNIVPYENDLNFGYVVQPADWNGSFDNITNYINAVLVPSVNTLISAANLAGLAQCRLSVSSTLPIADAAGVSTIYLLPYNGNIISTYDGVSAWSERTIPNAGVSLTLSALTFPANYDIFVSFNGTNLVLEALQWTNDTTPASRQTVGGITLKGSDGTRRLVGTIRTVSATTTSDVIGSRWVSNAQNPVPRSLQALDTTASWATVSTSYQPMNASSTDGVGRFSFVSTFPVMPFLAINWSVLKNNNAGAETLLGTGIDSTTVATTEAAFQVPTANYQSTFTTTTLISGLTGYHYVQRLQAVNLGTGTYLGGAGGLDGQMIGLILN